VLRMTSLLTICLDHGTLYFERHRTDDRSQEIENRSLDDIPISLLLVYLVLVLDDGTDQLVI
jgi:hypothetical protein